MTNPQEIVYYKWMYGDAGFLPFVTVEYPFSPDLNKAAYYNPLRWSSYMKVEDLIKVLEKLPNKKRPILLHKKNDSPTAHTASINVEAAINVLKNNTKRKIILK